MKSLTLIAILVVLGLSPITGSNVFNYIEAIWHIQIPLWSRVTFLVLSIYLTYLYAKRECRICIGPVQDLSVLMVKAVEEGPRKAGTSCEETKRSHLHMKRVFESNLHLR